MEKSESLYMAGGIENGAATMLNILAVPQIIIELPYDTEIPLLHIYPKELKSKYSNT